jgi:hypothetical protein
MFGQWHAGLNRHLYVSLCEAISVEPLCQSLRGFLHWWWTWAIACPRKGEPLGTNYPCPQHLPFDLTRVEVRRLFLLILGGTMGNYFKSLDQRRELESVAFLQMTGIPSLSLPYAIGHKGSPPPWQMQVQIFLLLLRLLVVPRAPPLVHLMYRRCLILGSVNNSSTPVTTVISPRLYDYWMEMV